MAKEAHAPTICIRNIAMTQYVGRGWRSKFECPTCHQSAWQHLNFLGQRDLVCNGVKLTKVPKGAMDGHA